MTDQLRHCPQSDGHPTVASRQRYCGILPQKSQQDFFQEIRQARCPSRRSRAAPEARINSEVARGVAEAICAPRSVWAERNYLIYYEIPLSTSSVRRAANVVARRERALPLTWPRAKSYIGTGSILRVFPNLMICLISLGQAVPECFRGDCMHKAQGSCRVTVGPRWLSTVADTCELPSKYPVTVAQNGQIAWMPTSGYPAEVAVNCSGALG